jgi:hypothetical protein
MDGSVIDKIIMGSLASAILFYLLAYVILPAFNVTYLTTITGLSTSLLQGLFFILFIVIIFSFVIMFLKSAGIYGGGGRKK